MWTAVVTSATLHAAALAVFGWLSVDDSAWDLAVDPGQAVSLAVVAAAPEERPEHEHPARIVADEPQPEPRPRAEAAPQAVVAPRPATEPPEPLRPRAPLAAEAPPAPEVPRSDRAPASDDRDAPQLVDRPVTPPRTVTRAPAPPAATLVPVSLPFSGNDPGANLDAAAYKLPTNPAPEYPLAARQRNEEGRVLLLVFLDADGRVVNAQLRASSGSVLLDQAAMRAVRQWRFSPARSRGVPVTSQLLVPVRFSLREAG
ncbi:MAG: energy transducer TonB [Pirellulaceae bacterium]|nr:energy transducer TonB [Pirellulaceae bacterium]